MSSKVKMRCNTCGKWFQSANAKEVTCPDCTQKARKEKLAAKNAPPPGNKGAVASSQPKVVAPPPKPKHVQSGTNQWLDRLDDVKIAEPEPPPPPRPKILPPAHLRENQRPTDDTRTQSAPPTEQFEENARRRESFNRGPAAYRDESRRSPTPYRPGGPNEGPGTYQGNRPNNFRPGGPGTSGPGGRPRQPLTENRGGRGPRPDGNGQDGTHPQYKPKPRPKAHAKPPAPPKPKREKIPPPEPFTPTEEQRKQVEDRYIELATPAEFDGIRTQIAQELSIPKKAVKQIIKDLRDKQHIPSWWEIQTYKGSNEELEKIKAAYLPFLPVPQVGVHKKIADELNLKPGIIYQAIKAIRLEMNLPQYNDPTFHEEELAAIRQQRAQQRKQHEENQQAKAAASEEGHSEEMPSEETPAEAKVLSESTVGAHEAQSEQHEAVE